MRTPFTGLGTALITPFRKDGSLDEAAITRLVWTDHSPSARRNSRRMTRVDSRREAEVWSALA